MHEMALAQDVLRLVKSEAARLGINKVSFIKIGVGASRVSHPAELLELFMNIARGTVADGARLEIEIIPVKGICGDCQQEIEPKTFRLDCPACGATNIQLSSGAELLVRELR